MIDFDVLVWGVVMVWGLWLVIRRKGGDGGDAGSSGSDVGDCSGDGGGD